MLSAYFHVHHMSTISPELWAHPRLPSEAIVATCLSAFPIALAIVHSPSLDYSLILLVKGKRML